MSLEPVWQSAKADTHSLNLDSRDYQARINFGVKITRDNHTDEVKIFNTCVGGDYYSEISIKECIMFLHLGWRGGCYQMTLENCKRKLLLIEGKIKSEVNGNKNKRKIDVLKENRTKIINRYRTVSQKLRNGNN